MSENWNPNTCGPACDWCGECEWCLNLGNPDHGADVRGGEESK